MLTAGRRRRRAIKGKEMGSKNLAEIDMTSSKMTRWNVDGR